MALTKDSTLSEDAWGDHYLDKAIELAEPVFERGHEDILFKEALDSSGQPKLRLLEVLLEFDRPESFSKYLSLLNKADIETAQLIIDNLRFWSLDADQKMLLLKASEPYKGKSKLLDMVIGAIEV